MGATYTPCDLYSGKYSIYNVFAAHEYTYWLHNTYYWFPAESVWRSGRCRWLKPTDISKRRTSFSTALFNAGSLVNSAAHSLLLCSVFIIFTWCCVSPLHCSLVCAVIWRVCVCVWLRCTWREFDAHSFPRSFLFSVYMWRMLCVHIALLMSS